MYLAQRRIGQQIHYVIRESYAARQPGGVRWKSRDLFDMGPDPAVHIHYPGGRSFYIDPTVEDVLNDQGAAFDGDELEDLLWPFVSPAVRYQLRGLRHRAGTSKRRAALTADEVLEVREGLHAFDKRRYYYLRCGRRDQGQLQRIPPKLFRGLLHKSRDELEHHFRTMESQLPAREIKTYIFAGFNLEARLLKDLRRNHAEPLTPQTLDQHFIGELCRINRDRALWGSGSVPASLREDLHRYVWMFFDFELPQPDHREAFIRQFIHRHRRYRPPAKIEKALAEARALFGMELKALKKLSRREFSRLYRRRARDLHPDTGGNPEKFIRLTAIYRHLLKTHF